MPNNTSKRVIPIKQIRQLHLCFDADGREIEVLDVSLIDRDTVLLEENPIFSEQVSFGDRIRVRQEGDVFYYIETLRKSDLARHSWLLSKEVSESPEIADVKERIHLLDGNCEQVFGGVLVINVPKAFEHRFISEINAIITNTDKPWRT